jgi:hypothetical protein
LAIFGFGMCLGSIKSFEPKTEIFVNLPTLPCNDLLSKKKTREKFLNFFSKKLQFSNETFSSCELFQSLFSSLEVVSLN